MVRFTFISDAGISTKLCESTRSLAEHNMRWNQVRVPQVEDLFRAEYKVGFDRKNRRNTVSFDVWRSQDFQMPAGTEFTTPEQAFVFGIDHVNGSGGALGADTMGGSGTLKMEFVGAGGYSATRYMHNSLLESAAIIDMTTGISIGMSYTFNGGVINTTP